MTHNRLSLSTQCLRAAVGAQTLGVDNDRLSLASRLVLKNTRRRRNDWGAYPRRYCSLTVL